jgi:hypothetical protein
MKKMLKLTGKTPSVLATCDQQKIFITVVQNKTYGHPHSQAL